MCDWNSCLYTWQSMTFLVWNYCIGKANIFFKNFSIILIHESIKCNVTFNSFYVPDLWPWLWLYVFLIKFIYSEKATKFCEISAVDLSYVVTAISQNLVAFSEYMNFNKIYLLTMILYRVKIAQLNILNNGKA